MGQRLVVTVRSKDEDICKIYYHWSAYSVSALMETKKILNVILDEENDISDLKLRLIRFCEQNGGGIDGGEGSDEWNYITREYPNEIFKSEGIDRSYGLIALSKKGKDDIQYWSEGDIIIDLDECRVINEVSLWFISIEEYNQELEERDEAAEKLEDIPELQCDLTNFAFEDIDYLIDALNKAPNYAVRYGNDIYELIA